MRHLIIYAHPSTDSLNHLFKTRIEQHLLKNKHEVLVRDLYKLDFDPVLTETERGGKLSSDILEEQRCLTWAEEITFIYPIWWTGMPAILKGYIDRIFSYGYAYRYNRKGEQEGLLRGKTAYIVNTQGKSKQEYARIGMDKALLLTSDKGIYQYCGLHVKRHFFFAQSNQATQEIIAEWTTTLQQAYTTK